MTPAERLNRRRAGREARAAGPRLELEVVTAVLLGAVLAAAAVVGLEEVTR